MKIYRWMKRGSDGRPLAGTRFGLLGVRPKGGPGRSDVDAQASDEIVSASVAKGLSASTDPTMPQSPGDEFLLWEIDSDSLGPALTAEPSPTTNNPGHYLVKPANDMTLAEYQKALASTSANWQQVESGENP